MSASEQEKQKGFTKERLIGMKIIDGDGNEVGQVQDMAFTFGKMGMNLIVKTKSGENKEIEWEKIQAAGEYVILKPVTTQATQEAATPNCSTCGKPLTWIPQYQRWYCYNEKKYA